MKAVLKIVVLVTLTLTAQRLLGHPKVFPPAAALLLPMPWLIGPPLLDFDRRWYWLSFSIGLGWDLLFEPVIGIGAIAWSAAALAIWAGTSIAAERRLRAWFAAGVAGTLVFWLFRSLCLLPLGMSGAPTWAWIGGSAVLTGIWCTTVRGVMILDPSSRWKQHRARRLR